MAIRAVAAADADYSFLDNHYSSASNCCSSNVGFSAIRWPSSSGPGHPPAGENGITVERSSNRLGAAEPSRPAKLVTGIIGGMALGAPG